MAFVVLYATITVLFAAIVVAALLARTPPREEPEYGWGICSNVACPKITVLLRNGRGKCGNCGTRIENNG